MTVTYLTPVPAHLLESALADARCQRDRARGECVLLATEGSPQAASGNARVQQWEALNPGFTQLLDWIEGAR